MQSHVISIGDEVEFTIETVSLLYQFLILHVIFLGTVITIVLVSTKLIDRCSKRKRYLKVSKEHIKRRKYKKIKKYKKYTENIKSIHDGSFCGKLHYRCLTGSLKVTSATKQ